MTADLCIKFAWSYQGNNSPAKTYCLIFDQNARLCDLVSVNHAQDQFMGAVNVQKTEVEIQKATHREETYSVNVNKLLSQVPKSSIEDDPMFQEFLDEMDIKNEYYRTENSGSVIKFNSVGERQDLEKYGALVFVVAYEETQVQVMCERGGSESTIPVERVGNFAIPCMFTLKEEGGLDLALLEPLKETGKATVLMELLPAIYLYLESKVLNIMHN